MSNHYKTSACSALMLLLLIAQGPRLIQAQTTCPSSCSSCSSAKYCTACHNGFYASTGSATTRFCSACTPPCDTCTSPSYCTSCESGYSLSGSNCLVNRQSSSSDSSTFLGLFFGIFFGVSCLVCIGVAICCYCRYRRLARERALKNKGRVIAPADQNPNTSLPASSPIQANHLVNAGYGANPPQNPQGLQPVQVMVPMYYYLPAGTASPQPQAPVPTADTGLQPLQPPQFQTLNLQQPVPYAPPQNMQMAGESMKEYPLKPAYDNTSNQEAPKTSANQPEFAKFAKGAKEI